MSKHNNKQVAQIWAKDLNEWAKGSNFFCEDSVIYSYGHHFPIAKIFTAPNGKRVAAFTIRGCSVTTAKHKGIALNAANAAGIPVILVEYLLQGINGREALVIANQNIQTEAKRLSLSRLFTGTEYLRSLQRKFNEVIDLFQLNQPKIVVSDIPDAPRKKA